MGIDFMLGVKMTSFTSNSGLEVQVQGGGGSMNPENLVRTPM